MKRRDLASIAVISALVVGIAAGRLSVQAKTIYVHDDKYWLYDNLIKAIANIANGTIVGKVRRQWVVDIAGDAPFIMNVDLSNVCVDVPYDLPQFWQPSGTFWNIKIEGKADYCDNGALISVSENYKHARIWAPRDPVSRIPPRRE